MKRDAATGVIIHRCQRGDIKYVSTLLAIRRDTSGRGVAGVSVSAADAGRGRGDGRCVLEQMSKRMLLPYKYTYYVFQLVKVKIISHIKDRLPT